MSSFSTDLLLDEQTSILLMPLLLAVVVILGGDLSIYPFVSLLMVCAIGLALGKLLVLSLVELFRWQLDLTRNKRLLDESQYQMFWCLWIAGPLTYLILNSWLVRDKNLSLFACVLIVFICIAEFSAKEYVLQWYRKNFDRLNILRWHEENGTLDLDIPMGIRTNLEERVRYKDYFSSSRFIKPSDSCILIGPLLTFGIYFFELSALGPFEPKLVWFNDLTAAPPLSFLVYLFVFVGAFLLSGFCVSLITSIYKPYETMTGFYGEGYFDILFFLDHDEKNHPKYW